MKKIESLTPDQVKIMNEVKKEWLDRFFSCKTKIDKEAVKKGVNWMYSLCGLANPIIIFVKSPLACQYAVVYLKKILNSGLLAKLLDEKKSGQVRGQVWDQVWGQVWDQVRGQVWDQVMGEYEQFSSYGNVWDYGWVSFYDFFQRIGVEIKDIFNDFKNLTKAGHYDMIQLKGFCIVSSLPIKIFRNEDNRLHNPNGPAIEFSDGYKLYFINGRYLPSWIWEKADKQEITRDMFLKEKNAEIKGGIYEVLGQKKMLDLLGAKEVDKQIIRHRNGDTETITLLKTNEKFAEIDNQPFEWVKMFCPSTGTQYLQGVEPHHTDALEAISSLSMFKKEEYSFDLRS